MSRIFKTITTLSMLGVLALALGQSLSVYAADAAVQKYEKSYGAVGAALPRCLLENTLSAECRNVSVFVALLINFGRGLFGLIGGFALLFFIYGGFNLIVSSGNPEKIKKGIDTMVAAVIGLFIAFAGYLLIKFMGEAVGLKGEFQLK